MLLQRYKDWRPTLVDPKGLGCEDKQDWYVAPVFLGYGADALAKSNFRAAKELLDSEDCEYSEEYFGHWGGNFSILLVEPTETAETVLNDIIARLADYPCLDEDLYSELELADQDAQWNDWGRDDFRKALAKQFASYPMVVAWIEDMPDDTLNALFFEACETAGYYIEGDGDNIHIPTAKVAAAVALEDLPEFPRVKQLDGCGAHGVTSSGRQALAFGCAACIERRDQVKEYAGEDLLAYVAGIDESEES
jgi:hypothetical protein